MHRGSPSCWVTNPINIAENGAKGKVAHFQQTVYN
jgi:hypothetical protein